MADAPTLYLDPSKTFSEVRGERTPADPQYRVCFWQGFKVGKKIVQLPFDSNRMLVHDDGKTEPWQGVDSEAKPCTFHPLYNAEMRDLVKRKIERLTPAPGAPAAAPIEDDDNGDDLGAMGSKDDTGDDVNFVSWLRGEVNYQPHELRSAAKTRFHVNFSDIPSLVTGLVLDEKLIPEAQVCARLARLLPGAAA